MNVRKHNNMIKIFIKKSENALEALRASLMEESLETIRIFVPNDAPHIVKIALPRERLRDIYEIAKKEGHNVIEICINTSNNIYDTRSGDISDYREDLYKESANSLADLLKDIELREVREP